MIGPRFPLKRSRNPHEMASGMDDFDHAAGARQPLDLQGPERHRPSGSPRRVDGGGCCAPFPRSGWGPHSTPVGEGGPGHGVWVTNPTKALPALPRPMPHAPPIPFGFRTPPSVPRPPRSAGCPPDRDSPARHRLTRGARGHGWNAHFPTAKAMGHQDDTIENVSTLQLL